MMLSAATFLVVALAAQYLVPSGVAYFLETDTQVLLPSEVSQTEVIIEEASPSPVISPSPSPTLPLETVTVTTPPPATSPTPTTKPPTGQVAAAQQNNSASSEDCDFEYHFDSTKDDLDDSGEVVVDQECEQEIENGGTVSNDVKIKVNTGGQTSDNENEEESDDIETGDVKVNVSIKNNTP